MLWNHPMRIKSNDNDCKEIIGRIIFKIKSQRRGVQEADWGRKQVSNTKADSKLKKRKNWLKSWLSSRHFSFIWSYELLSEQFIFGFPALLSSTFFPFSHSYIIGQRVNFKSWKILSKIWSQWSNWMTTLSRLWSIEVRFQW